MMMTTTMRKIIVMMIDYDDDDNHVVDDDDDWRQPTLWTRFLTHPSIVASSQLRFRWLWWGWWRQWLWWQGDCDDDNDGDDDGDSDDDDAECDAGGNDCDDNQQFIRSLRARDVLTSSIQASQQTITAGRFIIINKRRSVMLIGHLSLFFQHVRTPLFVLVSLLDSTISRYTNGFI